MAHAAAHQEPFTMYPNRYNDRIKPRLTDTQKALCDAVIRYTWGYHRKAARISNSRLMARTGKSEPAVIRAKKALEDMGLLVVLKRGGGAATTLYALDLYYDNRQSEDERRHEETPAPPSIHDTIPEPSTNEPIPSEPQPPTEPDPEAPIQEPAAPSGDMHDDKSADAALEDIFTAEPMQIQDPEAEESPAAQAVEQPQISDPGEASIPYSTEAHGDPTPNAALVPPDKDQDINIINTNKQTMNADAGNSDASARDRVVSRKAIAAVRYKFNSLFPNAAQDDDYPFWGWALKGYGLQACLDKLSWMREYVKQRAVLNPRGLLRCALTRDYQASAWIDAKLRADDAARSEAQRFRQECEERERVIASFDYGAAMANLQELLDSIN